jgi:outer membrane lipoprotein-sorting protein
MKTYLIFILSLLFLSGCMIDDNNVPEPTIDWENYNYVMHWIETESKTGESDWKNISDGRKLTFYSSFVDEKLGLPNNGKVLYNPSVGINIKNNASFLRTDSTLVFSSSPYTTAADTVILVYKLLDSSTLIISNTTVAPAIEIKYRRGN